MIPYRNRICRVIIKFLSLTMYDTFMFMSMIALKGSCSENTFISQSNLLESYALSKSWSHAQCIHPSAVQQVWAIYSRIVFQAGDPNPE